MEEIQQCYAEATADETVTWMQTIQWSKLVTRVELTGTFEPATYNQPEVGLTGEDVIEDDVEGDIMFGANTWEDEDDNTNELEDRLLPSDELDTSNDSLDNWEPNYDDGSTSSEFGSGPSVTRSDMEVSQQQ